MCSPTDTNGSASETPTDAAVKSTQRKALEKKKEEKVSFSELFSFLDTPKSKAVFFIGVFFAILNGCVYPVLAFIFSKSFSDLASLTITRVTSTALTFLGIGSYAFVASCLQNTCFEYVSKQACISFRLKWFRALLRQDMSFYDVHDVSGFASSIEPNAQTVKRGLGKKFGEGIQFSVTSIGGIIFALTVSWRVALLVLSITPLVSASALAVMKINQSQTESQSKSYAKAGSVAYQTVSSIRTVLALNAVPEMIRIYSQATQDAYNKAVRPLIKIGLVNGSMLGSFILLYCILTLYGASLLFMDVRKYGCDPSDSMKENKACSSTGVEVFGAMLGIAFAAQGLSQVANFIEALSAARAACYPAMQAIKRTVGSELGKEREIVMPKKDETGDKIVIVKDEKQAIKRSNSSFFRRSSTVKEKGINEDLTKKIDEESGIITVEKAILPTYAIDSSSDDGTKTPFAFGSIQFKDVVFSYPTRPQNPIYNLFSLDIPANATVAFVGPSGGGKSTAISLLMRFYDPISGQVCIDGDDIRTMNVHHLRDQIGLVNQEPTLFATSIAGNIAYGCPGVSQEQIEAAARLSNAHDFISSFPDGYNTQVGDKGAQLSGGQKQRIAIARVLVKNPKILLLDEATSALDSESELVVQEALDKLLEGGKRTTIVVAHRLTTIRKADKIAYVANGRVLEYGSHDELMNSEYGHYRALVEKQFGKSSSIESSGMLAVQSSGMLAVESSGHSNGEETQGDVVASRTGEVSKSVVKFNDVTFAYPTRPSKCVFDKFSLSVNRGETVALVGPSGGGKSTTVSLIERFYDPISGSVEFEGIELKTLNVHWLRDQIGYVGQEPVLFDDTISKNIAYGFQGASKEDIMNAAKLANAHDFIMSFPNAYDTAVGDRGTQLSGGQKQRIAIARALVKKPKLLILDEATSALDSHSESVVQSALDGLLLSNERTTIVIAHRLSTIRNATKIAFVGNGRVLEIGTHDELMSKKNGRYRRLVETQMRSSQLDLATLRELMYGGKVDENNKDEVVAKLDDPTKSDDKDLKQVELEKKYAREARSMALQDWKAIFFGAIGAIFAGGVFPAWGVMFALMINLLFTPVTQCPGDQGQIPESFLTCQNYWDDVADNMKAKSYELAGYWAAIVAGCLLGYALVFFGFGRASEGLNKRIRDLAFTALCRQEVEYFDKRTVGSITSQLQDDAAKIHAFSGQPIRIFLINLSSVIAGVIISFVYMWPFALVALALIPIMGFATNMEMKTYLGEDIGAKGKDDGKDTPGGVAIETLLNMRTVSALNMENSRFDDYVKSINSKENNTLWASVKVGSLSGISILVQQYVNALEFFWGGWLLINYPEHFTFSDFLVAMFSLLFALFAFGASSIGAVEKKEMQAAAMRIFELINRKSNIDSLSLDGKKL